MNHITALIEKQAFKNPQKNAICLEESCITYQALSHLVSTLSNNLQSLSCPGQPIAVMLPNSIELILCYLACFKAGILVVPLNYHLEKEDIEKILISVQAKTFIISAEKLFTIEQINFKSVGVDNLYTVGKSSIKNNDLVKTVHSYIPFESLYLTSANKNFPNSYSQDAILFHTSGSTGTPKGVIHTYRSVYAMLNNVNEAVQATQDTCMLIPLPVWHIGGFTHALSKLIIGATCVLLKNNQVTDQLFDALTNYSPNMLIMHIPCYKDLLYHPRFNTCYFKHMKECIAGGDKLPTDLQKSFHQSTGIYLRECYGMSEANLLTINREDSYEKCGSIGKPIQGVFIKIMRNLDQEADINEVGEIYCKGENIFNRYWKNEAETAKKWASGWLRTGDYAYEDKAGFIWFLGRENELIYQNNQIISPLEIEELAYLHPSVQWAAATSMPDLTHASQVVKLFIVLYPSCLLSSEELKNFILKNNAKLVPDEVIFVNHLPRGRTGKIDRQALKKLEIRKLI